jgi:hypothetical protein
MIAMFRFITPSLILGCIALALATSAKSQDQEIAPAPTMRVGDSWVFESTTQKGASEFHQLILDVAVDRVDETTMLVGVKTDGAPTGYVDHLAGLDWSKRQLAGGEEEITARPFSFPMKPGDTWSIDYVDSLRRGAQISDHVRARYKVMGWQDITVPAGTFRALKVVSDGVSEGAFEVAAAAVAGVTASGQGATSLTQTRRGGSQLITRATHAELYYVPKLKNYVKVLQEQYNNDNVRLLSETQVLMSYKLAD